MHSPQLAVCRQLAVERLKPALRCLEFDQVLYVTSSTFAASSSVVVPPGFTALSMLESNQPSEDVVVVVVLAGCDVSDVLVVVDCEIVAVTPSVDDVLMGSCLAVVERDASITVSSLPSAGCGEAEADCRVLGV